VPQVDTPDRVARLDVLKSFTHPLRLKLYYAIATRGSATATTLAQAVGTTPQLAYYHLRKMATLGVLEPDTEHPSVGRERFWKQATSGMSFDAGDFPEAAGDMLALHRAHASVHEHLLDQYFSIASATPADPMVLAAFGTDMFVEVTPEELGEINEAVTELLIAYRDRKTAEAQGGDLPTRGKVMVLLHAFPVIS